MPLPGVAHNTISSGEKAAATFSGVMAQVFAWAQSVPTGAIVSALTAIGLGGIYLYSKFGEARLALVRQSEKDKIEIQKLWLEANKDGLIAEVKESKRLLRASNTENRRLNDQIKDHAERIEHLETEVRDCHEGRLKETEIVHDVLARLLEKDGIMVSQTTEVRADASLKPAPHPEV